jgi:sphingolipid delta-4 desaturase
VQVIRLGRLKGRLPIGSPWVLANAACALAFDLSVLFFVGPNALVYLFASF